jgi:hypothetical protein
VLVNLPTGDLSQDRRTGLLEPSSRVTEIFSFVYRKTELFSKFLKYLFENFSVGFGLCFQ